MNQWFGWQVLQKVFSQLGSHCANQLRKTVCVEGVVRSGALANRPPQAEVLTNVFPLRTAMNP